MSSCPVIAVLGGQFELLGICGEGAMGTVYRARQAGMERQVAVKVLRPELLGDPKIVARFDREARAVSRLSHPNIVTFFTVGATAEGAPFVAMEYVDGESLAAVLAATPRLEPARALHIARQVCSALADAHAEGVVHRDLKPENILLAQKRRMPDFVKVLDFGIAKVLRSEDDERAGELESRLTRTGIIFGTPHYIAPEQAAGGEVDGRADLYSLGVILYRSLTGRLPFEGSGISVMLAHMGQTPPTPREIVPELDPAIEALVLRAMEKDPAQRFASAEDMADALEALGATLRGPQTSTASAPRAPLVSSASVPPARTLPPPPPRRVATGWIAPAALVGALAAGAAGFAFLPRPEAPAVAVASVVPAAVRPDAAVAVAPAPRDDLRPGYRIVTVGESGYAIRAQVPADARVGPTYELIFDVIDPDGTTTDDPSLPATIEEPGKLGETDAKGRAVIEIPQVGSSGRYVLSRAFAVAGRYHVHLYPIPEEPKVHIWFDVLVKDENGRLPAEPSPKIAHAAAAGAPPAKPRAADLSDDSERPDRSSLPPAFATAPAAPAAHEGQGDSDPYHLIEDTSRPGQVRPAPPVPYWRYRIHRRVRPRPPTDPFR